MTKKENKEAKTTEVEAVYRGSEVMQFANSLEIAIGNNTSQSAGKDAMWWAGWQLGQLRRPVRDYQDAGDHPRIKAMNDEKRRLGKDFDPSKFDDAQGMIDAANKAEHAVKIRIPTKDMFSDDVALIFAKVLSFMDID